MRISHLTVQTNSCLNIPTKPSRKGCGLHGAFAGPGPGGLDMAFLGGPQVVGLQVLLGVRIEVQAFLSRAIRQDHQRLMWCAVLQFEAVPVQDCHGMHRGCNGSSPGSPHRQKHCTPELVQELPPWFLARQNLTRRSLGQGRGVPVIHVQKCGRSVWQVEKSVCGLCCPHAFRTEWMQQQQFLPR